MRVKVSAPGKLLLMGDHGVVYDRPCLVMAVNRRIMVEVIGGKAVRKEWSEFIREVVNEFERQHGEIEVEIKIKGEFSSQYGLGSSAAVTVATAKALSELKRLKWSEKELFDFCFKVVRKVQGLGSGFDLAASIYGGLVYFKIGGKEIEKFQVTNLEFITGYSGKKVETVRMVERVKQLRQREFEKVESWFDEMGELVEKGKELIEKSEWQEFGSLMNRNQEILEKLGVSSEKLDKLIKVSLEAGVFGAKLSGAGGGDCMIAFLDKESRKEVEEAVRLAGGEVLDLQLESEGVRVER